MNGEDSSGTWGGPAPANGEDTDPRGWYSAGNLGQVPAKPGLNETFPHGTFFSYTGRSCTSRPLTLPSS